ncbi:a0cc9ca3-2f00-46f8-b222-9c2fe410649a [Thermothielavioides terrestris]|uniref:Uncharacterized protein n=2 Tax=Thermothielavioides terrestris TaxID=2587410 RepID=G2R6T2_THETT|nr:uncharacterized protein THITE_2130249 [Thermothielavioides terrestris NRRL 8126]AEO68510.1 hypothetical protein THITE_2130249 [Thermothielavioides terrestris NRRL 8126]SPQ24214.1 a0cc9ca3-2f00-46f8-b222-9c2fe410649a [Thermothielavioides terrestris]
MKAAGFSSPPSLARRTILLDSASSSINLRVRRSLTYLGGLLGLALHSNLRAFPPSDGVKPGQTFGRDYGRGITMAAAGDRICSAYQGAQGRGQLNIRDEYGRKQRRRGIAARFQAENRISIVLLLAVLMFSTTASGLLLLILLFRLMADAICQVRYGKAMDEPIEERLCKA